MPTHANGLNSQAFQEYRPGELTLPNRFVMGSMELSTEECRPTVRDNGATALNIGIACNQACLDHGVYEKVALCIVDPEAVNEVGYAVTPPADRRCVLVVDSGPGSLKAARVAARTRGYLMRSR